MVFASLGAILVFSDTTFHLIGFRVLRYPKTILRFGTVPRVWAYRITP